METRQIARFICGLNYKRLPSSVIEKSKICLIDALSATFAGADQTPVKILKETLVDAGIYQGNSTVFGFEQKGSVLSASLLNSAMAQSQELDDFGKTSILHVGSTTIPPALAAAEHFGKSGKELIEAIVAGYEVGIRVGEAVNPSHHKLWHTTGTCGTFAAAAAIGKLLNLDEDAMVFALGTAGTQAAGLNQYMIDGGEMSKPLHAGKAAMNGCLSAMLAGRGFSGATHILEGEKGFLRATSENPDPGKLVDGLSSLVTDYKIMSVTQRLYPVNGHILSVLTGLFNLLEKNPELSPENIQRIEIGLYYEAHNFLKPVKPSSTFLGRFSLPFCISLAVNERKLNIKSFSEKNLKRTDLLAFMEKVRLYEDPELTKTFPNKWSSKVRIVTADEEPLEIFIDAAEGDPTNPLGFDKILNKLTESAAGFLDRPRIDRLIERIMQLENIGDVSELI
jgi:2-methylcitrate dehydratase PrpD